MTGEVDAAEQVARVSRAFDAAFLRSCQADSIEACEDEHSNLMHHLYRLTLIAKGQCETPTQFHSLMGSTDELRAARALVWARGFDTHGLLQLAVFGDRMSNWVTNLYGVLEWKPLASLPVQSSKHGQHLDYDRLLAEHVVLDSTRSAFEAVRATM